MPKRKKYRFRCPICGLVVWENRLHNLYPLEVIDVFSKGRGLIKNVFLEWGESQALCSGFESHFYQVLEYLLREGYIDAGAVKKLADVYVKAGDFLHPDVVVEPDVICEHDVILHPKVFD